VPLRKDTGSVHQNHHACCQQRVHVLHGRSRALRTAKYAGRDLSPFVEYTPFDYYLRPPCPDGYLCISNIVMSLDLSNTRKRRDTETEVADSGQSVELFNPELVAGIIAQSVLDKRWWGQGGDTFYQEEAMAPSKEFRRVVLDRVPHFPVNTSAGGTYALMPVDQEEMAMLSPVIPTRIQNGPVVFTLKNVQRVQNEKLLSLFRGKATDLCFRVGFHGLNDSGPAVDNMQSILARGFAPHVPLVAQPQRAGPGTYLYEDSSHTARFQGLYHRDGTVSIILAVCALGDVRSFQNIPVEFDALIPQGSGANEFWRKGERLLVIQDHTRMYPAYVVHFTHEVRRCKRQRVGI
jgi:hypothetical protein